MMRTKKVLFSAIAALALVIFSFSGCDTGLSTDASSAQELNASRSVVREINLTGTVWLTRIDNGVYGVSRLDFTDATGATGKFGNTDFAFIYSIGDDGYGVLVEPSTKYSWPFGYTGNTITFENGLPPYTKDKVVFEQITIITSADLTNLSGSHWLGLGPRGESLLDDVVPTGTGTYTLNGSFGPDKMSEFHITGYTYSGGATGKGSGSMDRGAGDFNSAGSTATLTFPNFWSHGVQVVFYKFFYN